MEVRHECKRCGRELKDKRSIKRGYGPVCYQQQLRDSQSENKETEEKCD